MATGIEQKITRYIAEHPEIKTNKCSYEQFCSQMLKEGVISRRDYENLMKTSLFFYKAYFEANKEIVITNNYTQQTPQNDSTDFNQNEIDAVIKEFEEIYPDIKTLLNIDENGAIPEDSFSPDVIRQKYEAMGYTVDDKNLNQRHYLIIKDANNKVLYKYDLSSNHFYVIHDDKEYKVRFFDNNIRGISSNEYNCSFYWNTDKMETIEFDPFPSPNKKNLIINYDKEGKVSSIKNGKKTEYKFLDKIIENKKNIEKLKYYVLKYLDENNFYDVITEFKNSTGEDLLDILYKNEKIVNDKTFMAHIQSSATTRWGGEPSDKEVKYISNKLEEVINNPQKSNKLDMILLLLNDDNCYKVLKEYSKNLYVSGEANPTIPYKPICTLIEDIHTKIPDSQDFIDSILEHLSNIYIYNEEDDQEVLDFVKNELPFLVEYQSNKGVFTDDLKQDIQKNSTIHSNRNNNRLKVDMQRTAGRSTSSHFAEITQPNGEIDGDTEQGYAGDCWLLAALNSILNTKEGKSYINSLIRVNNTNVIVKLPGAHKIYSIPIDEINKSGHLSSGDGDIRAIEIAMDKYLKEMAYENKSNSVDINGNWSTTLFYAIGLKTKDIQTTDEIDFDNTNKFYTVSFTFAPDGSLDEVAYSPKEKENITLYRRHAYSIVGRDDKYIYLINPWDSSTKIRIKYEKFETLNPSIEEGEKILPPTVSYVNGTPEKSPFRRNVFGL